MGFFDGIAKAIGIGGSSSKQSSSQDVTVQNQNTIDLHLEELGQELALISSKELENTKVFKTVK